MLINDARIRAAMKASDRGAEAGSDTTAKTAAIRPHGIESISGTERRFGQLWHGCQLATAQPLGCRPLELR